MSLPSDALVYPDQCIGEAQESLLALSDALLYLSACTETDERLDGRVLLDLEPIVLAEERRCQMAGARIRRLERRLSPVALAELVQG